MKRKATMLFAVAVAGGAATTAAADPKPVQVPRTLASGQPACGNVMFKSGPDPACQTFRVILTLVREGQRMKENLPFLRALGSHVDAPLTLAAVERPRS